MDIQQDLQKPVGMALKAGTSGSHVQQQVHTRSGILSARKVTTSSLCVFLRKGGGFFFKYHLNHTFNGKSYPSPFIPEAGMNYSKSYIINGIEYMTNLVTRTDWGTQ